MNKKTFLVSLAAAAVASACTLIPIQPHIDVHYFDIGDPSFSSPENDERITVWRVTAPPTMADKMLFRTSPVSVAFDEYNRWSMPPVLLLKRHLEMVYDRGTESRGAQSQYNLSANILRWEADIAAKKANIVIRFDLDRSDNGQNVWSKTLSKSSPVEQLTGTSFAESVKHAMDSMLQELDLHIKSALR